MRILIIKPSSLGDIIHAAQVAEKIYRQLPNVLIDWVIRNRFAPILEGAPWLQQVYYFEREKGISGLIAILKALHKGPKYDYVLDFQGLFRTGLMTFAAHSKKKYGRRDAREGARFFYSKTFGPSPRDSKTTHALDILLSALELLGLERALNAPLTLQTDVQSLESTFPSLANKTPIVLIPHTRGVGKEWPHFKALAKMLLENLPEHFLSKHPIVWDSHRAENLGTLEKHPFFINTAGKTPLKAMAALIQRSHCVISNDSGPMHLAAAFGKRVIALFGPSSPQRFAPYEQEGHPKHAVLLAPNKDLKQLTVKTVYDAFESTEKF